MEITEQHVAAAKKLIAEEAPSFAERITPIYAQLRWYWLDLLRSPTAAEIEDEINELAADLTPGPSELAQASCGGLTVSIVDEGHAGLAVHIEFTEDVVKNLP